MTLMAQGKLLPRMDSSPLETGPKVGKGYDRELGMADMLLCAIYCTIKKKVPHGQNCLIAIISVQLTTSIAEGRIDIEKFVAKLGSSYMDMYSCSPRLASTQFVSVVFIAPFFSFIHLFIFLSQHCLVVWVYPGTCI